MPSRNQAFGQWYHDNSAMGQASKELKKKAKRNRAAYIRDQRAMEQWARHGCSAGVPVDDGNEEASTSE